MDEWYPRASHHITAAVAELSRARFVPRSRVGGVARRTKDPSGETFLFVVNLQLPRSLTKTGWGASVVLYWAVPLEALAGE